MKTDIENINCVSCSENCVNPVGLNDEELKELLNHRRIIAYNKGETIYKQSTYISHIVFVHSGIVKIFTEGKNGKNIVVRFVPSGQFIGLPFLFNNNYAFFSATAIKETKLCMIEKNFYSELVLSNQELNKKIVNLVSQEMGALYDKMTIIGTKQMHGRLATAILELADTNLVEEDIYSVITKKELAEFSGMSPESLMRLLNEFKSDKIIMVDGKQIRINDPEMLLKLSQLG